MARKRYVSSAMGTDEDIADIAGENITAALMWPWFITGFDDWGRMEITSPMKIKLELFPSFPFDKNDIISAIDLFANAGLVFKYSVGNKNFIAIEPCKFYKYQPYIRASKRLEDGSGCPIPVNAPWENCAHCRANSRTSAESREESRKNIPSPSPSPSPSKDLGASGENSTELDILKTGFSDIKKVYDNSLGLMTQTPAEDVGHFLDDGIEPDVIIEAIKETARQGKRWKYTIGILNNCLLDNAKTLEQFKAREENFKNGVKSNIKNNSPPTQIKQYPIFKPPDDDEEYRLFLEKNYSEGSQ